MLHMSVSKAESQRIIQLWKSSKKTNKQPSPPMVLSWYSWNWPLTKRSTRLDLPTADSPNSTSLNWQILLLAAVPLVRAGPPRPAILQCWKLGKRRRSWGKRVYGWLQAWAYYRGADEVKLDVGKFRLVGRFTGRRGGLTSGSCKTQQI